MKLPRITPSKLPYGRALQATTLRDFSGGWNVADDDMNMSHKFAPVLTNCFVAADGSMKVRCGTKLFAKCASSFSTSAHIVNMEYYNASIIAVGSNGQVLQILADGSVTRIFDTAIAAALPGAPSAWGPTDFVSFAPFNGKLTIHNGSDKPLEVSQDFSVEYLHDAATGTNINVPIGRYAVAINRYLVVAGDPLEPDRVHISAKDAAGTWYGDPPPNDATRLDVGSVLPNATVIRGLMPFRGKLVVMFAEGLVFGTLGIYDDNGNHAPDFDDGVEGYGSISHRAGIAYGDDGLFVDLEGVPSLKKTIFAGSLKPERISELIDPDIRLTLAALSFASLEDRVFAVYNKKEGQFMFFVPNTDTLATTTETTAFVLTYRPQLRHNAWSLFSGWNFTCGTRSLQSELFFADKDCNIWLYTGDEDFVDETTPADTAVGIEYTWEFPWLDFREREKSKTTKYISFDTRGASEFTVEMFCDNLLAGAACAAQFSAGDQGGFGEGPQPFGGGRNTSRKKLHAWPAKFQIMKLRISGIAKEGLSFVSITLHYLLGGIRR